MPVADLTTIRAGFIPLLDAAVPIAAEAIGFCAAEGLRLNLVRETSWASIRDRMAIGHFDVAHMLAPMPIAAALGIGPMNSPMIAPMALGLGGNAVTVSAALWREMVPFGAVADGTAARNGEALRGVVANRARQNRPQLTFGIVHPFSSHNYELRYWLAACRISPERDIRFVVVPPPYTADALVAGRLDGFCVGEPWNSIAVMREAGVIATTKAAIWRSSPEKVLGVRTEWANANRDALAGLLRALAAAAAWCAAPSNVAELARLLARPDFLNQPAECLLPGLTGQLRFEPDRAALPVDDFLVFFDRAATFPWLSHAAWFYSQMVRCGDVPHTPENAAAVRAAYRPDLYRAALAGTGIALPTASSKVEGALVERTPVAANPGELALGPDGFFDGRRFDPDTIDAYIAANAAIDSIAR